MTSAIDLIKHFEGCRLSAYPDPATGGKPWTIGWGHTGGVSPGDTISQADADRLLEYDLGVMQAAVLGLLDPLNLPDYQVAALTSFAYNVGIGDPHEPGGGLRHSTLLKRIRAGEVSTCSWNNGIRIFTGPAFEFAKWNRGGGKVMAGLTARRLCEALVFCGHQLTEGDWP